MSTLADSLTASRDRWLQIFAADTSFPGIAGGELTATDVTQAFEATLAQLAIVETSGDDRVAVIAALSGATSAADDLQNAMSALPAQGRRPSEIHFLSKAVEQICLSLMTVRQELAQALPFIAGSRLAHIPSLAALVSEASRVSTEAAKARDAAKLLRKLVHESTTNAEKSKDIHEQLERLTESAKGYEREANNAQINAGASASATNATKEQLERLTAQAESHRGESEELLASIRLRDEEVDGLLKGASKVGLARSFRERRKQLETTQRVWSGLFFLGISLLAIGAALLLWAFPPSVVGSGLQVAASLLTHLLPASPILWFTWFAARKAGQLSRLTEDYAFKEATALAFVGYRAEMTGDDATLTLLRKTAVENFGSNPARLMTNDDPASPIHDALARVLKKVSPDQVADVMKEALRRERSA